MTRTETRPNTPVNVRSLLVGKVDSCRVGRQLDMSVNEVKWGRGGLTYLGTVRSESWECVVTLELGESLSDGRLEI